MWNKLTPGMSVLLVIAAVFSSTLRAQAPDAALMALPRDHAPAETLATMPPGTFLENLVFARDGSLLITSYFAKEILRFEAGQGIGVLTKIEGYPVALEPDVDGTYYMTVHGKTFREGRDALVASQQIWRMNAAGKAEVYVTVPQAQFLNGIARLAPGVFLMTDSLAGVVWKLDVATKTVTAWLKHADLESVAPQQMRPGANGIRVVKGDVLVSNSTKRTLLAIRVGADGSAGEPKARISDVPIDDFAVAEDGTVFATTHRDQVVRIRADGAKHVVAEHADVKGNTSAVFGARADDRDKLYVIGDGGMFFGGKSPSGLVRLTVGVRGAQ